MNLIFTNCYSIKKTHNFGLTSELLNGSFDFLNENYKMIGIRNSIYPTSYFSYGFEADLLNNEESKKNSRVHVFAGLHFRKLKYIKPYLILSGGYQYESGYKNESSANKFGLSIKAGIKLEVRKLIFSIETGGGTLGTGNSETSISFGYVFKSIPVSQKIESFTITSGIQNYTGFDDIYSSGTEDGFQGYVFSYYNKNSRTEFNLGLTYVNYEELERCSCEEVLPTHSGMVNFGFGRRLDEDCFLQKYIDITPGFQLLFPLESGDSFLPAASIGIQKEFNFYNFNLYLKSQIVGTYSPLNHLISGMLWGAGFGYDF